MTENFKIIKQIEKGTIVSPKSQQPLFVSSDRKWLQTRDGSEKYALIERDTVLVPILLLSQNRDDDHFKPSNLMIKEYNQGNIQRNQNFIIRLLNKFLRANYMTTDCKSILENFLKHAEKESLVLNVGGGPDRTHPNFINLNIGAFENVDIVADAHMLPYATESIDAIFCTAVLEHLCNPQAAVKEMYRVLKKGGAVLCYTPFLQAYHGYPFHYQNFTLRGHEHLFESNGFQILSSGVQNGPMYTLVNLTERLIKEFFPPLIRIPLKYFWYLIGGLFLKPFDIFLNNSKKSHILANSAYVLAKK